MKSPRLSPSIHPPFRVKLPNRYLASGESTYTYDLMEILQLQASNTALPGRRDPMVGEDFTLHDIIPDQQTREEFTTALSSTLTMSPSLSSSH